MRLHGQITPEVWNRFGTKILPKLRSGSEIRLGLDLTVEVDSQSAAQTQMELNQILEDLGVAGSLVIEENPPGQSPSE